MTTPTTAREALEEAAKICDAVATAYISLEALSAKQCADSIRALVALLPAEPAALPETHGTWEERCAALYQVIGALADAAGVFETSDSVADAMDVAIGRGDVEKLLPWPKEGDFVMTLLRTAAPKGSEEGQR